jgi:hypothetical protein
LLTKCPDRPTLPRGAPCPGLARLPDGTPADLRSDFFRLIAAGAVADYDLSARGGQLEGDRTADTSRGSGDERKLAVEPGESIVRHRQRVASASSTRSSAARLFTGIAFTLLSMRLTSPDRTLPGPTRQTCGRRRERLGRCLREANGRSQLVDEQRSDAKASVP